MPSTSAPIWAQKLNAIIDVNTWLQFTQIWMIQGVIVSSKTLALNPDTTVTQKLGYIGDSPKDHCEGSIVCGQWLNAKPLATCKVEATSAIQGALWGKWLVSGEVDTVSQSPTELHKALACSVHSLAANVQVNKKVTKHP